MRVCERSEPPVARRKVVSQRRASLERLAPPPANRRPDPTAAPSSPHPHRLAQEVLDLPVQAPEVVEPPSAELRHQEGGRRRRKGLRPSSPSCRWSSWVRAMIQAVRSRGLPVFRTGGGRRVPQSTTSRLPTSVGLRSSSSSTPFAPRASRAPSRPCPPRRRRSAARRDDRACLLPLQHRGGDLGRVREVRQARLDDLDAGAVEPALELSMSSCATTSALPRRGRHDLGVLVIVGVTAREQPAPPTRSGPPRTAEVLDVELRLSRVADLPDDDRGDLDRVADQVVHLELLSVQVVRPERDRFFRVNGFVQ